MTVRELIKKHKFKYIQFSDGLRDLGGKWIGADRRDRMEEMRNIFPILL